MELSRENLLSMDVFSRLGFRVRGCKYSGRESTFPKSDWKPYDSFLGGESDLGVYNSKIRFHIPYETEESST